MTLIVPAVLPTSRNDLDEKLALLAAIPSVSRVQIDVVDGRFASPVSWPYNFAGEPSTKSGLVLGEMLPYLDRLTYEIDLMCINAEYMAEEWLALGASRLTFHAESTTDLGRLLASSRKRYGAVDGLFSNLVSFGVALNLSSDLALIEPILDQVEYVQFMGIARIGRQGQPFDRRVFEKLKIFHEKYPKLVLQVDGGVSLENAKRLIALGVSNLVIGSALLTAKDVAAAFAEFEVLQTQSGV
jgi:ribulose-phosphate 3-epimerase